MDICAGGGLKLRNQVLLTPLYWYISAVQCSTNINTLQSTKMAQRHGANTWQNTLHASEGIPLVTKNVIFPSNATEAVGALIWITTVEKG